MVTGGLCSTLATVMLTAPHGRVSARYPAAHEFTLDRRSVLRLRVGTIHMFVCSASRLASASLLYSL